MEGGQALSADLLLGLVLGFCGGGLAMASAIALAFLAREEGKEKARQEGNPNRADEKL